MKFKSDNEAPAHPRILQAVVEANAGHAAAYAEDRWSRRLDEAFSACFETRCRVFPLATGTAANSVTLAAFSPPWGAVMCHRSAHIHNDEGGAPEFYTHGAKLLPLDGENGKLSPGPLAAAIDGAGVHGVHNVRPAVVSITQATECGTAYRPDEIAALAEVVHARDLPLHMDGARFANAVAHLAVSPAEATWRSGVDVLSFGATKNGALTAEAIVVFGDDPDPAVLEAMARMRKRGGHLLSKMRYVSAQLLAMLDDELWLDLARSANRQAARLAAAIEAHPAARLAWPVEANEVFMQLTPEALAGLHGQGFEFHIWPGHDDLARLVCSFATTDEEVDRLIEALNANVTNGPG
ncbi:low specificity L-threonine aldolase [Wenzhouxiangella sp. XN79A]|uniref:threonine aldolase family protein n=1 Tax=Wenzhouxiangella sp. XN79A TaxID=2724193 RepID=UPI00144A7890|nr:beta-eliminating lyase-related protein [Wenzhouxiangella sp. XN79A]NKI34310.1 low specificity L-threonine aldolase [Wenzhouxiangella sp. XN79A]